MHLVFLEYLNDFQFGAFNVSIVGRVLVISHRNIVLQSYSLTLVEVRLEILRLGQLLTQLPHLFPQHVEVLRLVFVYFDFHLDVLYPFGEHQSRKRISEVLLAAMNISQQFSNGISPQGILQEVGELRITIRHVFSLLGRLDK